MRGNLYFFIGVFNNMNFNKEKRIERRRKNKRESVFAFICGNLRLPAVLIY